MTVEALIPPEGITGLVALILMGVFWLSATIGVLCIMEVGHDSGLIGELISANRITCRVCLPSYTHSDCIGWKGTASTITPGDM